MILLINLCSEKLSSSEFIDPIKRIVGKCKVIHYSELNNEVIEEATKIIICGTALKDNESLKSLDKFEFLKTIKKPVFGICAGMQLISLIFDGKLIEQKEIGMTQISTTSDLFDNETIEAYALHKNSITLPEGFTVIAENDKGIQAIKKDNIYGILFHPEVRNYNIIKNFLK